MKKYLFIGLSSFLLATTSNTANATNYEDSMQVSESWGVIHVPTQKMKTQDIRALKLAEIKRLRDEGNDAEADRLEAEMKVDKNNPNSMLPPNYRAVLENDPLLFKDSPPIIYQQKQKHIVEKLSAKQKRKREGNPLFFI